MCLIWDIIWCTKMKISMRKLIFKMLRVIFFAPDCKIVFKSRISTLSMIVFEETGQSPIWVTTKVRMFTFWLN